MKGVVTGILVCAAFYALLLLAACGTAPPQVAPVVAHEVSTAVAVSCVPADFPTKRPIFADNDAALKGQPVDTTFQLLTVGRPQMLAWIAKQEAIITHCRTPQ